MNEEPISAAISHNYESAQVETTLMCLCALESSPNDLVRRTIKTHPPYPALVTASQQAPTYRAFPPYHSFYHFQLTSSMFFKGGPNFKDLGT